MCICWLITCMARNNPVTICATRQIPNSDPKIHQPLIVDGVGNY